MKLSVKLVTRDLLQAHLISTLSSQSLQQTEYHKLKNNINVTKLYHNETKKMHYMHENLLPNVEYDLKPGSSVFLELN